MLKSPTVKSSTQSGSKMLKVPVCPPVFHDASGGVDCCKVALERDVSRCHVDACAHALKRTTPAVETAGKEIRHQMMKNPYTGLLSLEMGESQ